MRLAVTTSGGGRIVGQLRAQMAAMEDRGASALRGEHEVVMTQAKQLCPVAVPGVTVPKRYRGKPGTLRASGHVQPTERAGATFVSRGGFGGPAASYAVFVHEDPDARHVNGQWKFYETPLLAARNGLASRLAAAMWATR